MSFKKIIILVFFLLAGVSFADAHESQEVDLSIFDVTTQDLIDRSLIYEGRKVIIRGEVIGDVMPRGAFAWINIKDQYNQVGIWIPLSLTKEIVYRGNYRFKGDKVEVEGIFKHADAEFGGEFCIRAMALKIIEPGSRIKHPLSQSKINIAWSMLGVTFCLFLLRILVSTKKKESKK